MGLPMGSKPFEQNFSNIHLPPAMDVIPMLLWLPRPKQRGKMQSRRESRGGGSPRVCGASPAGTRRPPALLAAPAPLPLMFSPRLCLWLNRGVPLL